MPKSTSHKNRGLKFEALIQDKCNELKDQNIALINKVPTEWKVIRNGARIVNAYPVSESKFVDFIGIWNNGKAIALEAKETKNKTSFPFSNIKESQIIFFDNWNEMNGIGYYIIRFEELKRVFLVDSKIMNNHIRTHEMKSTKIEWFEDNENAIELDYSKLNFEKFIK